MTEESIGVCGVWILRGTSPAQNDTKMRNRMTDREGRNDRLLSLLIGQSFVMDIFQLNARL